MYKMVADTEEMCCLDNYFGLSFQEVDSSLLGEI